MIGYRNVADMTIEELKALAALVIELDKFNEDTEAADVASVVAQMKAIILTSPEDNQVVLEEDTEAEAA